jgi:hypothetical protein
VIQKQVTKKLCVPTYAVSANSDTASTEKKSVNLWRHFHSAGMTHLPINKVSSEACRLRHLGNTFFTIRSDGTFVALVHYFSTHQMFLRNMNAIAEKCTAAEGGGM